MVREEKDVKTESEWRLRSFLLSQNNRMLKDAKDLLNEGRLKKKKKKKQKGKKRNSCEKNLSDDVNIH